MLAAINTEYGPARNLRLEDVPTPTPGAGEVLVKVYAAAVNDFEFGIISGKPYIIRFFLGLLRPKIHIPGCDLSGRVVAVGEGVSRWQVGDAVYGDLSGGRFGSFAEYVCCREEQLVAKPPELIDIDAAALPQAVVLALQGLEAGGGIRDGQRILINGAGGGVGLYAIQIAKRYDVHVTGVDSADKAAVMLEQGYDRVLDYRNEDFTREGEQYDLIVDTKTFRSPFAYPRALRPGGVFATVGGSTPRMFQLLAVAPLLRLLTGKRLKMLTLRPNYGLERCNRWIAEGVLITPVVEVYAFDQVHAALAHFEAGRHKGKVVLRMPVLEQLQTEDGETPATAEAL